MMSISGVLLMLAAQASAAPPQVAVGDDIVVVARRENERKTAETFVRSISVPTTGQLARFRAAVCPLAIGFAPAVAAEVVARLREVTVQAGGVVDTPGCRGNLILIAAPDGGALVRAMRNSMPGLLQGLEPQRIDRLIAGPGPVRAWNVTALENEDGKRPSGGVEADGNRFSVLEVRSASILKPPQQQVIDSATIVIDDAALIGKTATQVADYAAMRTLARTRPVEDAAYGTILGLFTTTTPAPAGLTETDRAYLKGLYRGPGNMTEASQVRQIGRGVVGGERPRPVRH